MILMAGVVVICYTIHIATNNPIIAAGASACKKKVKPKFVSEFRLIIYLIIIEIPIGGIE